MSQPCVIALPELLNVKGAAGLALYLNSLRFSDKYIIDFSRLKRAFPFSILLTVANFMAFYKKISGFAQNYGRNVELIPEGINTRSNPVHGYLAHIGFFQDLGIDEGRYAGEAWGSQGYVPIRHLTRGEIVHSASSAGKHYGDVLVGIAESLAVVVTKALKPESPDPQNEFIFKAMSYTVREILRNSFEHSRSDEIIWCGQNLPRIGCAEIAILDNGIGIHKSLAEKHGYRTEAESLLNAMRPGISSNLDLNPDNKWGNSGFGLYATRRMCTFFSQDQFALSSSGVMVTVHDNDKINKYKSIPHQGTAVMIKVSKHEDYYFENLLERIILEGEAEARTHAPGARASKMSKVLK